MVFDFKEEVKISFLNPISNTADIYYVDLVTAIRIFIMQENAIAHPIEGRYSYNMSVLEFNARTTDEADRALLGMKDDDCWVRQFATRRETSDEKPNKYRNRWKVYITLEQATNMYTILEEWNKEYEIQRASTASQSQQV